MISRIKHAAFDGFCVNAPWGGSLAFVHMAELKDFVAIICMSIGAICTILVTHHRLKSRKQDDEEDPENESPDA